MFGALSKLTKFAISGLLLVLAYPGDSALAQSEAHVKILRDLIKANGFKSSNQLFQNSDEKLASVGKVFFESKGLSLNSNISCQTCHLEKFGSSDGIPVAAAIGGAGEGPERLKSGAKLLGRNTLGLWGVGGTEFKSFFWDGRVEFTSNKKISPFGSAPPAADPLVTAIHLPVVEIREMLDEDSFVLKYKKESAKGASAVFDAIADNLRKIEPQASKLLADLIGKPVKKLTYVDYARSIASFIRSEFRIRPTKLESFVNNSRKLSEVEIRGGILFYGKGRCATCHSGPLFSDFNYHVVPFPQMGFGKSGFGIDYGRYEVTFNPADLYKFRTPPLYNVAKTSPYGHSGSLKNLEDAVTAHFNPLSLVNILQMDSISKYELFKRLSLSSDLASTVGYLTQDEVKQIVHFLKTLNFTN